MQLRLARLQMGLELTCQFGEASCTDCQGKYSIFKSETTTYKCGGIPHKFADSVKHLYIEDFLIKAITQKEANSIAEYGTTLLGRFSYSYKGWNHANENLHENCATLDEDHSMNFAGYRYKPHLDVFSLRYAIQAQI